MTTLFYIHDPMCSWCWAFAPVLDKLQRQLPAEIRFTRLLGGLAPDNPAPMAAEMREQLQATWRRIEQKLPEIRFNFDFWSRCEPRRSTYPACRAVIAARSLNDSKEQPMIRTIQQAYYRQTRNPSDAATLIELAGKIGLDPARFRVALNDSATDTILKQEIAQAQAMHATSFPALVLELDGGFWPVPVDYHSAEPILETIAMICGE
ncbi:putative protein-disulfide isomerase [endosymbiont of Ridgeia piscesae]|jgi:putative protein-disulfide isomerase|uniref:DSBA-like thioredoxin domain-containing protein n=3 Tax=endosymbiont of Ridgeia piscesae TaxID=54398 RepID=A0A0T5YY99_9GAMM|nr:DsbA family protein [endosymbiont of Ridgeia piscesae]KRT55489.1 putative protein-disulfide isomerase [endosymbiont of Ridgeia piscesae]